MAQQNLIRIKAVLAEKGQTGVWLAEQMGVAPRSISRWIQGKQQPRFEDLARIAELLGVSICDLFAENVGRNFAVLGATVYTLHVSKEKGEPEFAGLWADLADLVGHVQQAHSDFPGVDQVQRAVVEGRVIKCSGLLFLVASTVVK